MNPVYQTRFGEPAGNCYAACIASILERPLEEFDHQPADFYNAFTESWELFMASKGYGLLDVDVAKQGVIIPKGMHYIACGPSPRGGFDHAVVHRDGQLAHDPHPSGAGLETVKWAVFVVDFR